MKYICETSHGDKKVGRALSGWGNPNLHVHPPTINVIAGPEIEQVNQFILVLFKTNLQKLVKVSFAEAIAATILMYLRDTLLACHGHQLHSFLILAAHEIFPFLENAALIK